MDPWTTIRTLLRTEVLPTLPETVARALTEGRGGEHVKPLTELVSTDVALAANLLRMVNSSYYGHSRQVVTVDRAVELLGPATVQALALGTPVLRKGKQTHAKQFDPHAFWRHSARCGAVADAIAEAFGHEHAEQAELAGLLHDIGILVLAVRIPEYDFDPHPEGEDGQPALNHAEVGARLARHWKFDPALVAAIEGHHLSDTPLETQHPLARLVHLAEWLTDAHAPLDASPSVTTHTPEQVADSLGYTLPELERLARALPENPILTPENA